MKLTELNRQVALFGDFNQFDCGLVTMKSLETILSEFDLQFLSMQDMPIMNVNIQGIPQLKQVTRPFLYKEGNPLSVRFSSQRIDVQYTDLPFKDSDEPNENFRKIVDILFNSFSLKVNRLAYNGKLVAEEIDDESTYLNWFNNFFKSEDGYSNVTEWSFRIGRKEVGRKLKEEYKAQALEKTEWRIPNDLKHIYNLEEIENNEEVEE